MKSRIWITLQIEIPPAPELLELTNTNGRLKVTNIWIPEEK